MGQGSRTVAAIAVILLVYWVIDSAPVGADNWGTEVGSEVSFGNNDTHKVNLISLTNDERNGAVDIMA